jgi:hypothetical protein
MARLPIARREDLPTIEEQLVYDKVVGRDNVYRDETRWTFQANYGILLNSPKLAELIQNFGNFYRSWVPHVQRDLVTIVVAVDMGSTFVLLPHIPNAVAYGIRPKLIAALIDGTDNAVATEAEALLVRYIRQVASGTVEDDTFAAIEADLGVRGTLELTANIAWVPAVIRMMQAFALEQPPMSEAVELLDRLRAVPLEDLLASAGTSDYAWPTAAAKEGDA